MTRDAEFLRNDKFIDYSVLLAVEYNMDSGATPRRLVNRIAQATTPSRASELKESRYFFRDSVNESLMQSDKYRNAEDRHKFTSKCGRFIYHIAIIDFLTEFNFTKKLERWFKTTILAKNADKISDVPP